MNNQKNLDPLLGQRLGNFLVQQSLGRGGMARVYKGLDTSLKRPVAIKVIAEGLRTPNYAQRFEHEAQAVAGLKHPYIVTIFHFGQQNDLYYLVMEYIDGTDLDAILRNYENNGELMPHADVTRILGAIALALDYAHGQGVIHRDVKPSNIMLERDGRPVLTDFGLALRVSEGTVGEIFGSPHYISPEQAQNSANSVPQSDLYSLGIIAYEMLTGVVPFDDPNPSALVMQHILAPVPSPRAMNRDLSEEVDAVLSKALAKVPSERYATSTEFIAALSSALERLKNRPMSKVATNELPPLPPGVVPPPPRRLSMQTAHDKLIQEVALTEAKGQALTYLPEKEKPKKQGYGILPYAVAAVGVIALLSIVGFVLVFLPLLHYSGDPAQPTSTPTATIVTDTPAPVVAIATTVLPPTSTPTQPPTTVPTTAIPTSIPPSETPIPPTLQPPTAVPTTAIPTSSPPSQAPAQAAAPTVLFPDGRLFVFVWDATSFYMANESAAKVAMGSGSFTFDRLTTSGSTTNHFDANRWALNYVYSEPNHCMILNLQGKAWRLPTNECPAGYNSQLYAFANEIFWTPADNSTEFRVSWAGKEVGRCTISQPRCEIRIPKG